MRTYVSVIHGWVLFMLVPQQNSAQTQGNVVDTMINLLKKAQDFENSDKYLQSHDFNAFSGKTKYIGL